jgi:anti-sigma regulatory factor (Ser/Thr protein kinase)
MVAEAFVHPAFLYGGTDQYLAGCLSFIHEGLDAGDPVAVAVPTTNLGLLRDALGGAAERVVMSDMTVAGRNPGRIIPGVLRAFADQHPLRRVRIIGEPIWAQRSEDEYPACAEHEALINVAFEGRPVTILCPYNTRELDRAWVHDAHRTHPVLWSQDGYRPTPHYRDPVVTAGEFSEVLSAPPETAATLTIGPTRLAAMRRLLRDRASRAGLTAAQTDRITLAANELATNAIQYGEEMALLRVWTDADHLICQVETGGRITDPLAGRAPLSATTASGRGLPLVNQFCDLVRTHTSNTGTTTRVYMKRPARP